MNLPDGRLLKSRVVDDPRDPLAAALDRSVTGYAVLEPQEALLLDTGGTGVLTFRDGVPELAYHTGTDRGGPEALADLATPGPYHVELYDLAPDALDALGDPDALSVPPGMPAERLAGDPALAASTRRAAPEPRDPDPTAGDGGDREPGAVEAFLRDEAKIEAIREQAREEAERRAEEWGFDV
ncbi:hypothetical protein [Halomicrobium salinisoli]|uniref:hypothetical protein n=1 Tax=Halomicrobium salinisoli TaxID=2878391 RepID=UPI001CF01551|nr:hypothetical protein [Halomicrobium salinisoli]